MRDATPCIAVYQPGKWAEKGSMLPNSLFFFDDPNTMPNIRDDVFRLRARYLFPVRRRLRADQNRELQMSGCRTSRRHIHSLSSGRRALRALVVRLSPTTLTSTRRPPIRWLPTCAISTRSRSGRGTERRSMACSMPATVSAGPARCLSKRLSIGRGSD